MRDCRMKQGGGCMSRLAAWMFLLVLLPASAGIERVRVAGFDCHVVRARPGEVSILWKGADGELLRTFSAARRHLDREGTPPQVLMNGGIFEPGGIPSGLLVQGGVERHPVNRADGRGNFFLKPNGILVIGSAAARVIDTAEYPLPDFEVRDAVQSGPLLLRGDRIHPAFRAGSESRLHRNGVGVDAAGRLVFVMTERNADRHPNLHEFAGIFRELDCRDALFLDGDISQMRPAAELDRPSNRFGTILAIVVGKQPAPADLERSETP